MGNQITDRAPRSGLLFAAFALATSACGVGQSTCRMAEAPPAANTAAAANLPGLTGRIVDQANIIPDADEPRLARISADLEARTTDQLAVATLASLNGQSVEDAGLSLANRWRLGQSGQDNGVLLLVAPNDRRVRIEVGYGLEAILSDQRAQAIIDETIVPAFSSGQYATGIERGAEAIRTLLVANADTPRIGSC